jgi:pilus assembly protein Flp/PilA
MLYGLYVMASSWVGSMRTSVRSKIQNEIGATAAEYALLVTLIAIAIIAGATALGVAINGRLDDTATQIGP